MFRVALTEKSTGKILGRTSAMTLGAARKSCAANNAWIQAGEDREYKVIGADTPADSTAPVTATAVSK